MQVFHAAELARRETVVRAYSLMPGLVESGMTNSWASKLCAGRPNCPMSQEEGAATTVYVATASEEKLEDFDGKYFRHCRPVQSVRAKMMSSVGEAATLKYQRELYDLCLEWSSH